MLRSEYHEYICEVAAEAYNLKPKHKAPTQVPGFVMPDFEQWGPDDGFQFELPAFDRLPNGCPFGQTFYELTSARTVHRVTMA